MRENENIITSSVCLVASLAQEHLNFVPLWYIPICYYAEFEMAYDLAITIVLLSRSIMAE